MPRKKNPGICVECNRDKNIVAKRKCAYCYNLDRYGLAYFRNKVNAWLAIPGNKVKVKEAHKKWRQKNKVE